MTLKPQDLLVSLKLWVSRGQRWTYPLLATSLGMSVSETHGAVKRAVAAGLLAGGGLDARPNADALREFVVHGAKYAFPASPGGLTRGMPTAHAASPLKGLIAQSDELTALLPRATASGPDQTVALRDVLREAVTRVLPRIDRDLGGLAGAPKFPNTMTFDLLASVAASGDERAASAREALAITLDAMARGGIWDHLGGGFARYSTDIRWHVPHFEKMLYDNAQLARLYLDGAHLVGRPREEASLLALAVGVLRAVEGARG